MTGTSVDGELGDEARGHFWRKLLEAGIKGLGLMSKSEQGPGQRCQRSVVLATSGQNTGLWRAGVAPTCSCYPPRLSAYPAPPHPLRRSSSPSSGQRSSGPASLQPARFSGAPPLTVLFRFPLKLSCHCFLRCPPVFCFSVTFSKWIHSFCL